MTTAAPRTSFVIPAHNAGQTLLRTLDSLLAQGDADWEAVLVDDASSDETPQLIAACTARDARFIAHRIGNTHEAHGPGAARNAGLQRARGRRLVFLDSDDWLASTFLERMHEALDAVPGAAVAYCDYCRAMPDGELAAAHSEPEVAHLPFDVFARTCAVAIHAVLIEREWVLRAGAFDTSLRTCEDWDLWQRVARLGSRWVHVAQTLAFYRCSEHSLSRDADRVLADAGIVIQRGFGADPRLADPAPAHAAGAQPAPGADHAIALAFCVLWCHAVDAARERGLQHLHEALAALPCEREHTLDIANTLLDGVIVGLRAGPQRLAARWADYGARLSALVERIGVQWDDGEAARRLQYAFETLVLQHDDLADRRTLTLTMALRVDLRAPPLLQLPEGVDRLHVHLCEGSRLRAVVEPGALGDFAPRQWVLLAARRLGWREVMRLAGPAVARSVTPQRLVDIARTAHRSWQQAQAANASWRQAVAAAARCVFVAAAATARGERSHAAVLDRLRAQAAPRAEGSALPPTSAVQRGTAGSAASRRDNPSDAGQARSIPVLSYRRIAHTRPTTPAPGRIDVDAFAEQMAWLHQQGYHTLTAAQLAACLRRRQVLSGRPVMITFDNGDQDFADAAWPVLRRYGFGATVFVAADLASNQARRDRHPGASVRHLDAATITRLAAEGVTFGSQLGGRGGVDGLPTHELATQLLESRARLGAWAGRPIEGYAVACGSIDDRLALLAAECGYVLGLSANSGAAHLDRDPMRLPRIEMRSDMALRDFVGCMEAGE